jgi:hypothetical protein
MGCHMNMWMLFLVIGVVGIWAGLAALALKSPA